MTTTEAALLQRIDQLATAVQTLTAALGTRLNRTQLAARLGVSRNTLTKRLAEDRTMPRPGADGKWLLSELVEWEQRRH